MSVTQRPLWPTARATRDTVVAQFGEARADLAQWALTTADPLADAAVAEMHEMGMTAGRAQFARGTRAGLQSLDSPTPALAALLQATERVPDYVDANFEHAGPRALATSVPAVHLVSLSAGALLRVYQSPSIATVLTTTGRLVDYAERRITETGKWLLAVTAPGALRVGEPGYVATLEVRILHAHMRRLAHDRGYDAAAYGEPINQIDLGRTWMDFTYTSLRAEESLGFALTPTETAAVYRMWWLLGHLLGIDPRLIEGLADNAAAARVDALFEAVTGPPPPESKELAAATISAVVNELRTEVKVPPRIGRPLMHAIVRHIHGDAVADGLGIGPNVVFDRALAGFIPAQRRYRSWSRRSPQRWEKQIASHFDLLDEFREAFADTAAYERGATGTRD